MLKKAVLIGASSGIGAALARTLVREGHHLAMLSRRTEPMEALAQELRTTWPDRKILVRGHDVTNTASIPGLFSQIATELDGIDLVIYNAGVMPAVDGNEYDTKKDHHIFAVNLLGAVAWLNLAAQRFDRLGAGTIVGVGSVAGDRGRLGNPAYCASKAGLDSYLESLRNRLWRKGVHVVTIKPGPVQTAMTEGREGLPLMIEADDAAEQIWSAISGAWSVRYVPLTWWPIMRVVQAVPSVLFRRLSV